MRMFVYKMGANSSYLPENFCEGIFKICNLACSC